MTHYTYVDSRTGEKLTHKIVPKHDRGASNKPRIRVICFDPPTFCPKSLPLLNLRQSLNCKWCA